MSVVEDGTQTVAEIEAIGVADKVRLELIKEAAQRGVPLRPDCADWLKNGVEALRTGAIIDAAWLHKQDQENAQV